MAAIEPSRQFHVVLIKPSHYDDEGYVIRWWRAIISSNSLAAVYGIAAERQVLMQSVIAAFRPLRLSYSGCRPISRTSLPQASYCRCT